MNDHTVIASSDAANEASIRLMPGWHGPDESPDVPRGADRFFQIAVRRKNSEKVFSFPAVYCNSYAVTVEYDPHESQGNGWSMHFLSEDLADEGELGCTGWWDIKSDNEYEFHFTPALNDGDELVGWCELPQWETSAQEAAKPVAVPDETDVVINAMCKIVAREAGEDFERLDRFTQELLRGTQRQALRAAREVAATQDAAAGTAEEPSVGSRPITFTGFRTLSPAYDGYRAELDGVKGHPLLGDIPWVTTSSVRQVDYDGQRVVRVVTRNNTYVLAPTPEDPA